MHQISHHNRITPEFIPDDITGRDYAFVGNNGLLSDRYEQAEPQPL